MITYLLVYLCSTAAMDDCSVYLHKEWRGPLASIECDEYLETERTALPGIFEWPADLVGARCVSQPVGG